MKKCGIMVICRHPEILATIVRLINNNPEWSATGCETDQSAIDAFKAINHDVVLIGSGVNTESETQLRKVFINLNPLVKIVQHYGGGSGLLSAEIYSALNSL
ncbi:MAG: hypothetical protein JKY70_01535 [Mucilaginibacter sp.]|nr:hypothetical protein [Mucilaginibacter sp.]